MMDPRSLHDSPPSASFPAPSSPNPDSNLLPDMILQPSKKKILTKQMSLCVDNNNLSLGSGGSEARKLLKASLTVPSHSFDFDIPALTLTLNPLENDEVTIDMSGPEEERPGSRERSSSIGSASSLLLNQPGSQEENKLPGLNPGGHDLSIRRVSEISHINELRREVSGLDHLASEFYEISRQPNPDSISLDSIHKKVLQRCQNKYIPPTKSSTGNKCFVILTGACTVLGIVYGFWYKNFGKYG